LADDCAAAVRPKRKKRKRFYIHKAHLQTLEELDQRTAAAQRARALTREFETDLGRDLSTGQRELVKRAALLSCLAEDCEVRWLKREEVDLDDYCRLVNAQRRVLTTIGLERRAIDVSRRLAEDREAGLA
jgi:hypothetical protein